MPASTTFGPYELLHVLGRGGMGTAYLATKIGVRKDPLVIKVLHPEAASDASDRARFEHESKLAISANVGALAKVYDAGIVDESPYIAMELVRGMSISRLLAALRDRSSVLSVPEVLKIARSAVAGVRELHEALDPVGRPLEVIHRDLSPGNLMLDPAGRVRILDLGVGRSKLRAQHTATGVIIGTPGYMSPEQTLSGQVTQRSDVYMLGVLFWELLAGRRYIPQGDLAVVLAETVKKVFEPPSEFRPGLSPLCDEVCRRALERDPEKRFASAAELEKELEALSEARLDRMTRAPVVPLALIYELDLPEKELEQILGPTEEPVLSDTLIKPPRDARENAPTVLLQRVRARVPVLALMLVVALAGWLSLVLLVGSRPERQTFVVPMEPAPAPAPVSIQPRELEPEEPEPEPEVAAEPEPQKAPEKKIIRKKAADPAPVATAEKTAETLMSELTQLARSVKRARPDLSTRVDDLINAGVFETAGGDTPAARARLKELTASLKELKANAEKRDSPRDP